MNVEKCSKEAMLQFFKFSIVGLSNTVLAYIINIVTLKILGPFSFEYDYVIANLMSFLISVLWSFCWNSKFVFHRKGKGLKATLKALSRTYASYGLCGIFLNNLLSWLWITHLGISRYLAPLINLLINVPFN